MLSLNEADKNLRKWKFLFFGSLVLAVCYFIFYIFYSMFIFEAEQKGVMLNQINAIYSKEDLGMTNVSEGEVKQFAYKVLKETFTFDYMSFSYPEMYQKLVSGEVETDLPDHRDLIRNYYSSDSYEYVIDKIQEEEWMSLFYRERRFVTSRFFGPPVKVGYSDWERDADGILNQTYKGFLFVVAKSKSRRAFRYRLDYNITLERKPNPIMEIEDTYYYFPMVPMNTFEWQVKSLDWEVKRSL
jgi:hypothetical protein